ncbi:hypothetical protein [Streptomyces sp. NPDC087294]|uniref:hypothetical protein n=1 Tax=Streptomyces sp. NPDC087294 TaxID=3365777 RepID=UPI00380564AA
MSSLSSTLNRRLVGTVPVVVSGTVAVLVGIRLHAHHLPWSLLLACTLAVFGSVADTLTRVVEGWSTTTHRCTVPGCGFTVQLAHTTPAENRRWQETAAAHPGHTPR